MLTEDDLTAIAKLLVEHDRLKAKDVKKVQNATRQRRFRERNAGSNAKVTQPKREKRNVSGNATITPINGNAVAYIPIVGGAEFGVSKELLAELEAAYPQVDGPATLKEARVWCIANPLKRKTARGVPRFLNNWFQRLQNG